jgi:hypothetical protein
VRGTSNRSVRFAVVAVLSSLPAGCGGESGSGRMTCARRCRQRMRSRKNSCRDMVDLSHISAKADQQACTVGRIRLKRTARDASIYLGYTLLIFSILCIPRLLSAQTHKPLTAADLRQMKTAGFDDQTIINAIAANGVSLDTSVQGLISLKQSGLSEKVIDAALAAATPKPPPSNTPAQDPGIPDEIGAYAMVKGVLTSLPVEVVNFKTAGMLGAAFSYGIHKAKLQGTVPGERSSSQLTLPVTLTIRCADGTAPTEYQLVPLESKKDIRQFTEAKVGLTGASGGVDNQAISLTFQKIARNTYKAMVPELKRGEYGFLAPGALASANGASSGKLYTFGIVE